MTYFITAIGIVYVIFGVMYFMRPDYAMRIMDFFMADKRIYIAGGIRVVLGGLLIYCAQGAVIPWIPRAIGILALAGAVVTFAIGIQRIQAMVAWFKSDKKIRVIAVIAEAVGILLIYSA